MANTYAIRLVLADFDQWFTDLSDWPCGNAEIPTLADTYLNQVIEFILPAIRTDTNSNRSLEKALVLEAGAE